MERRPGRNCRGAFGDHWGLEICGGEGKIHYLLPRWVSRVIITVILTEVIRFLLQYFLR